MAGPTLIQIKRSLNTGTTPTLANGEMAFTANGDVLFIGSNAVTIAVAGKRAPGVLTANQSIVTNTTNMIDVIRIGNTTINAVANSEALTLANSTVTISLIKPTTVQVAGNYYLKADGSWSTVSAGSALPAGANTNVQYNDSGVTGGVAAFTFDEVSNTVFVSNSYAAGANTFLDTVKLTLGNTTVNAFANSLTVKVADTAGLFVVTPAALTLNAVSATTNGFAAAPNLLQIGNTSISANHVPGGFVVGTSVQNATTFAAGANVVVRTTEILVGNSVVNTIVGNTQIAIGNTTVNAVANSISFKLSNSTVTFAITLPTAAQNTAGNYFLGANGTWQLGGGGGTLDSLTDVTLASTANNDLLVYDNVAGQWENHAAGNGFNFAGNQTLDVRAGTSGGLSVNSTGVWVTAANGVTVTAAGVNVLANNGILANSTGVWATGANGITVTAAGINVLANNGIVANTTGVFANIGTTLAFTSGAIGVNTNLSITDLTLAGNLTVSGTLVTVDATNLVVNDSIISLARNNGADVLDIGMYGQYNDGSERFTGLIWDTTDKTYYLFSNTSTEPTTTLSIADANLRYSTLRTYLISNAFVSNATAVNITATASTSSALTINTLSVSAQSNLAGQVANSLGFYPTSNTVGQLLGNTISRWDILYNGGNANSTGLYPISNTVGQAFGNTISRWNITGNTIALAGQSANSLGLYPISNTAGQLFGNNISRWDIFTTGQSTNSTGIYPISNTVGQAFGNTIARWEITANTLALSTALLGTSGGTGLNTIADQSILKGNATNGYTALALGTAGLVLQSFGGALVYDTLDGGTF